MAIPKVVTLGIVFVVDARHFDFNLNQIETSLLVAIFSRPFSNLLKQPRNVRSSTHMRESCHFSCSSLLSGRMLGVDEVIKSTLQGIHKIHGTQGLPDVGEHFICFRFIKLAIGLYVCLVFTFHLWFCAAGKIPAVHVGSSIETSKTTS